MTSDVLLPDPTTVDDPATDASSSPNGIGSVRVRLGSVLVWLLVAASIALAVGLYFFQYRPDTQSGASAADAARQAAVDGSTALLSYAPETLDADLASAKSHLTGDFLSYYSQFADEVVAPAAREKSVKTSAEVVRSAVSDFQADTAKVLIFTNQTTTSSDKPDPTTTASSVLVTVTKEHGTWLISSFDPV